MHPLPAGSAASPDQPAVAFRQAAGTRIITAAHAIHAVHLPDLRSPARFGLDPSQQVQVLCPMARGG